MEIRRNRNSKTKKRYPLKVMLDNGTVIPVPSQHNFQNSFIQNHGCSLVGFYMAMHYKKKKHGMTKLLSYAEGHLKCYSKYPLREIAKGINRLCAGSPATYHSYMTTDKLRKKLHSGCMALFEERDPIHTVVLLYDRDTKKLYRFSDGKRSITSTAKENKRRCKDTKYKGVIIVE